MKGGLLKSPSSAGRPKPGQSNIRGKISGPIPIHNPAEDDEFPIRERGTGHATPLGGEGPNRLAPPPERGSVIDSQSTNGQVRVSPEERTPSRNQLGTSQTSENSGSPAQQRTIRSSTLRYSTVSNNTDSEHNAPQRKKSTLRNALSKLFGRKKKGASSGGSLETHHEDPSETALQRSEPSSLNRGARSKEGEPKRSASLPITEFDRALRSHSVGPEDISAIESVRNSLQVEPMKYRKRAATTTSRLFNTKSRDFGELQQGLSPRPASAQGRGNQEITDDDPSNIGRAITSDILTMHRRSRSLSQLQDDGTHLPRRRSDEIRYWRESYNPGLLSPTSSNANEDNEVLSVERPESPAKPNPMTPPQPFNFGSVAGMKITQAVTIEERITNLETSNQKLEKLVYQLFQLLPGVNEYPTPTERPSHATPRPYSSAYSTGSVAGNQARENLSRDSNDSFGDENTFIGSIPPSSGLTNRPVSTATVRGATSMPTIPRDLSGQFTPDHYTTLLAIIETERSARQALEAQVHKLSTQLQLLSRASQKDACANGPVYSTFEHDDDEEEAQVATVDDDMSGSEAFKTPNEEYSQHGFGAFGEELTDEESDGRRKRAARTLSLSQLTLKKPAKPPKSSKKHPEAGVNL